MTHTTAQPSLPDSGHTSAPAVAKTTGSLSDHLGSIPHLVEQCVRERTVNY